MASSKADRFDKLLYEQSLWSKANAHPARIKIIDYLLAHGITPYKELCKAIPLARETVSQHLRSLRKLDIIKFDEKYPHSYYELNQEKCRDLLNKAKLLYPNL